MTIISLFTSKEYTTGGHKRYLELLRGLATRGFQVIIIKDRIRDLPADGCEIIDLDIQKGFSRNRVFGTALKQYLKGSGSFTATLDKTDLIFQFGESASYAVKILKKNLGVPVFIALRNNWVEANKIIRSTRKKTPANFLKGLAYTWRDRWVEASISIIADHIIFQTSYDRDRFRSRQSFPLASTTIIPNSIRASWLKKEWKNTNKSTSLKKLLFIGSASPRKGLEILIAAFLIVQKKMPELSLNILGSVNTNLEKRLKDEGLGDAISFCGYSDNPLSYLAEVDLLVVPSYYDSFPNTIMEAFHTGTPVIGSDIAGITTMLKDPRLLFPPGNAMECADRILSLVNPETYYEIRELCHNRALEFDFDWIEPWEQLILSEMGRK